MTMEEQTTAIKNPQRQRKHALLFLALLFTLIAIIYLVYWFKILRHYEQTDDAYVAGNQVQIMAQVSGNVTQVNVDNTDRVHAGDILAILDPTDTEQAYARAKTALANSVRQTHQLIINGKQLQANIRVKRSDLQRLQSDLQRRKILLAHQAIGREELQHAQEAVHSAQATLDVAIQQYNANQAVILDTPLPQQPIVEQAASQLRDAWLALQRTRILSPINGYISRRSVQVGSQITTGTPLMVVVPADQIWIDANFKETQLVNMRIGQQAMVISDFYGDSVIYQGKVVGLDMGTGSAFSLLPAQNATGNWIKVVQRLPVRIALDVRQLAQHPLRIGLSTTVKVDTANREGLVLAVTPRKTPAYTSSVLTLNLMPVNQIINDIIQANTN